MEISVKLFGGLRSYLPVGSAFNACSLSVDDQVSLQTLLAQLPIPADKPYLVILNDAKVSPEDYATTRIDAADELVLLPPIKGG